MVPYAPDDALVTSLVYREFPSPGHITGFTYGHSLAGHPPGESIRAELCITVRSTDERWPHRIGQAAAALQGRLPFHKGIAFTAPPPPDTPMRGFAATVPPAWIPPHDALLDVSHEAGTDTIRLVGCHPLHQSEIPYVAQHGLSALWHREWDRTDITRPPVT